MTDEDFCALYEAHARRLWAYVTRAIRDGAAAEDIVQEAFARVFRAKAMETEDEEHRRRYLYTVATNLIRRRYRGLVEVPFEERAGHSPTSSPENAMAVTQALSGLTRIERQTLWLAYVEGWSWREVGRLLGYREGSIRQVGVRARRRFRELFGESRP
ncbi:MAG TPA: sigma-70 family RNA polymerase sigma factor [Vicinamibacterales bacterium]|nr:sigma-70 family RNA polymerase sigma factor [Vicinamibacterales bacterium]